ncbi:DUF3047 domain-containing protein [Ramlibacter sp. GTP1]|uniref:DUF3047 domain-containing protein n=1 Tax=Ramlibacter albus TaxID=2079448 RepID=A0A923S214_9BURK|nr:DUF3047 domain-containing protein [Ramlibacter albus]
MAVAAAAALLAGCASLSPGEEDVASTPWAQHSRAVQSPTGWVHQRFPGKQATEFHYARKDGRDAMAVLANASASMLRRNVHVEPAELGRVRFSWMVPELIAQADIGRREADDSPVRIILAFEGDRSRFSPKDALLNELARTITGEEMPYATLMYVWCTKREPGSVVKSPRTDRIRKIVLESGTGHLNRWLDYERDIRADFERAFGEAPGALVSIGVMTDSDNTRSTARAWYGPVRLVPVASR